jgi:predicted GTPase
VLVVEDGPTLTHGGMPFGAGTVAVRHAGARELMDPRPYAVGSIAETFARHPQMGAVLPAMGYGKQQIDELEATIAATPCDVVVTGTPIDLRRVMDIDMPVRHATYELREIGTPTLADVLAPLIDRAVAAS